MLFSNDYFLEFSFDNSQYKFVEKKIKDDHIYTNCLSVPKLFLFCLL